MTWTDVFNLPQIFYGQQEERIYVLDLSGVSQGTVLKNNLRSNGWPTLPSNMSITWDI